MQPKHTRKIKVDVMVSSTVLDLPDHRKQVMDAIWRRGLAPIGMEMLPAQETDAIGISLGLVEQAEVYVGVLGYRYGYIQPDPARNPDNLSLTEMEYRRAKERGIPVLMFVMDKKHPPPATAEEAEQFFEQDPAKREKLEQFKADAMQEYVSFFDSPQQLSDQAFRALTNLIENGAIVTEEETEFGPEETPLIAPPEPHIPHPYVLTQKFFGRAEELQMLDDWAASDECTTMIVEAIGGVGKSALTWEWVHDRAEPYNFDGVLWWSFYESDSAVSNFTRHALAYLTGQTLKAVGMIQPEERERQLLEKLCDGHYLLVLDGLERILVAYHRIDAPHVLDGEVETDLRGCTDDRHALFLQKLTACAPTKILISTRLTPSALENQAGDLLPNVTHHELNGLHPDDAVALMRHLGVQTADEDVLREFMDQFGRHSLLLTALAGRIGRYRPAPGDFDAWYADEGHHLRLTEIEIKQRRTGILQYAFAGLKPELRKLLRQVAAFRYTVDYVTISALNPYTPSVPVPVDKPSFWASGESKQAYENYQHDLATYEARKRDAPFVFHAGLTELEDRGLLQWDRVANKYDLHPIVRAYGFDEMDDDERKATFLQIRDHFESVPPSEEEQNPTQIAHLRRLLEIYFALIGAGLLDDAAGFYQDRLRDTLLYHMATYHLMLELLKPLFSQGTDQLPPLASGSHQSAIVTELANAFYYLGQNEQSLKLKELQLKLKIDQRDAPNLGVGLTNYALLLRQDNHLAAALRADELARDLAEAAGDVEGLAFVQLYLLFIYKDTGQWAQGEAAYAAFEASPPRAQTAYWQASAEQYRAEMLIFQRLDATEALDRMGELALQGKNALSLRQLHRLRGEVALQQGNPASAAGHFLDWLALARQHGSAGDMGVASGRLAVALAMQGQHVEARRLIAGWVQSIDAAEVYLILGERERAEERAIHAYKHAWADGPPHVWWWQLERAKKVLDELGVEPPDMPPYDPANDPPIPYEDEIRGWIAELRAEKEG